MNLNRLKHKKIISAELILLLLVPFFFLGAPKQTEAGFFCCAPDTALLGTINVSNTDIAANTTAIAGTSADIAANTTAMVPTSAITAEATEGVWWKEYILDPLLFAVVNVVIEEIADSTVDWINNGFEGGPGFITNYGDFLTDVGDKALGEYIEGSALAFLCHPFALDIKAALQFQFGGERRAHCTLTDVFENADNALSDLGEDWSWSKWNNISSTNNNFYGAYAKAYTGAVLKRQGEKDQALAKAGWAGGLLNFDKCETEEELVCDYTVLDAGESCKVITKEHCVTHTPGSVIQDTLSDTLQLGNQRLIIADEIDEIIAALLSQLIKTALSGGEGLLGSDPDRDYKRQEIPSRQIEKIAKEIDESIKIENDYKGFKLLALNYTVIAENNLLALIDCWTNHTSLTQADRDAKISAAQWIVDSQIAPLKAPLGASILSANQNLAQLENLKNEIQTASDPLEFQALLDKYDTLKPELHTGNDAQTASDEADEIMARMDNVNAQTATDLQACQK